MRHFFTALVFTLGVSAIVGQGPTKDVTGDPLPKGAIARLGTERMRTLDGYEIRLHPDGKRVIGGSQGKLVELDPTNGTIIGPFTKGDFSWGISDISADGSRAVSSGFDGASVWDCKTGKAVWESKIKGGRGMLHLSGDGKFLAVGGSSDQEKKKPVTVTVYDVDGKKEVASMKVAQNSTGQLLLSANGKRGVSWGYHYEERKEDEEKEDKEKDDKAKEDKEATDPNRRIQFWDVEQQKEVGAAQLPLYNVASIAISPSGDRVAVSEGGGVVLLFDAANGKLVRQLLGRRMVSEHLTFSADSKSLAASGGGVVQVWDVATGNSLGAASPPANGVSVLSMVFTAADRVVVLGQVGEVHLVWEAPSGKLISPFSGHTQAITGIAFTTGDKEIVTTAHSDDLNRWDTTGKKLATTPLRSPGLPAEVYGRTICPQGTGLVVRDSTGAGVMVYDLATGIEKFTVPTGYSEPLVAVSGDGKRMVLGMTDRKGPKQTTTKLTVIDPTTGTKMSDVPTGLGVVRSVVVTPNGKRAALVREVISENDRESKFFVAVDLEAGKVLGETKLKGFNTPTMAAAADNATALGIHPETGELTNFDLTTGKLGKAFGNKQTVSFGPVFSPDGKRVAVSLSNFQKGSDILVFDYETGKKSHTFRGHLNNVTAMAFSTDGKTLATGAEDTTVLLWNLSKE